MLKSAVKRTACDPCRAKRIRCLRAQDSTAPCARCCYTGAQCVTSASGNPGRPPKRRLVESGSTPRSTSTMGSLARVSSHRGDSRHRIAEPDLTVTESIFAPRLPRDPLTHESRPDFWPATDDSSTFFGSDLIDQSPLLQPHIFSLAEQLSSPSQLQRVMSADDEINAMIHMDRDRSPTLNMVVDPLLGYGEGALCPSPPIPCLSSAASSLVSFREEIEKRITTLDTYYSNLAKVQHDCENEGAGQNIENPAAVLLTYSAEFTKIIRSLTPTAQFHAQAEDTLSTEIVLLALSTYLTLMRLFDTLFHCIHRHLCQVPPESYRSLKVKSVLRVGGVVALQDMPLKAYAIGIVDAIQCQVQTLEHCMGIPAKYCLSGEVAPSSAPGIFSRPDRAKLFRIVMAQEDVKSRQGGKLYVESIRDSIKQSIAFLND